MKAGFGSHHCLDARSRQSIEQPPMAIHGTGIVIQNIYIYTKTLVCPITVTGNTYMKTT